MQDESVIKTTGKERDRETKGRRKKDAREADRYVKEKINIYNREAAMKIDKKTERGDKEIFYL
jgi:hypothetical protein